MSSSFGTRANVVQAATTVKWNLPANRAADGLSSTSIEPAGTSQAGARIEETLQTTTTFSFDGYRIGEYKGVVRGIVVRSPTLGQGFLGGLKQIVGGQIGAYAEMCEQAREQAYDLLLQHARALRANAIVGVRYESSEVGRA